MEEARQHDRRRPVEAEYMDGLPILRVHLRPRVARFCAAASAQLVLYRGRKGEFARNWIFRAAATTPAYEWWEQFGATVPELQTVACMILSLPASASIIERINSEFAFVKDRRRNRLGHGKSNMLVGLFHNLRLLKRMRKLLYTEQCVGWNDEDDKTGSFALVVYM